MSLAAMSFAAVSYAAMPILAFLGLGPMEIAVFGVIALLLFGRRLPEVMRSMGKGVVEFKRGLRDIEDDAKSAAGTDQRIAPPPPPPPPPAD